ncbi:MAG: hypothetical protein WDN10_05205 [bacterium]
MATKKKTSKGMLAAEIGAATLAAAAAAGAGYYFYASKDAKKHRKAAVKWAEDLRRDVMKEAKKLKTLDAKTMALIVDEASQAYQAARGIDRKDLKRAADELKANWQRVVLAKLPAKAKKAVRKAKKAVKKTVKRAKKAVKRR